RRRAWDRSGSVAPLSLPPSPAADGADLSAHVVEKPELAADRGTGVARRRARPRGRAADYRRGDRGLRGGSRGVARAAFRPANRAGRGERVSGPDHALARAARAPDSSGLPRSAGAAAAWPGHGRVRARQPDPP